MITWTHPCYKWSNISRMVNGDCWQSDRVSDSIVNWVFASTLHCSAMHRRLLSWPDEYRRIVIDVVNIDVDQCCACQARIFNLSGDHYEVIDTLRANRMRHFGHKSLSDFIHWHSSIYIQCCIAAWQIEQEDNENLLNADISTKSCLIS